MASPDLAGMPEQVADTVAGVQKPEVPELDENSKAEEAMRQLEASERAKVKGNAEYAAASYKEAVNSWNEACESLAMALDGGHFDESKDRLEELHQMDLRLCLNMAQVHLKLGDWRHAVSFADRALIRDGLNLKALYRKATAQKQLSCFKDASATLEVLLKVEPDNKAALALLAEVRRERQLYERKTKRCSQKMLAEVERDPRVRPSVYQWASEQVRGTVMRMIFFPITAVRVAVNAPFAAFQLVCSVPQKGRDARACVQAAAWDVATRLKMLARRRLKALTQRAREALEKFSSTVNSEARARGPASPAKKGD